MVGLDRREYAKGYLASDQVSKEARAKNSCAFGEGLLPLLCKTHTMKDLIREVQRQADYEKVVSEAVNVQNAGCYEGTAQVLNIRLPSFCSNRPQASLCTAPQSWLCVVEKAHWPGTDHSLCWSAIKIAEGVKHHVVVSSFSSRPAKLRLGRMHS